MGFSKYFLIILCLFLGACAMPRIVEVTDPLDAAEHNDLGVAYEHMGETELALRHYQKAFSQDDDWDQPLINHGNVHAGKESWEKAENSYQQALERNPENPEAMNNLAYVLLKQEKKSEALDWSRKAVDAEPENPFFLHTLGMVLEAKGEQDRAGDQYIKAMERSPEDSSLRDKTRERLENLDKK